MINMNRRTDRHAEGTGAFLNTKLKVKFTLEEAMKAQGR
jgi:hypothetical protein